MTVHQGHTKTYDRLREKFYWDGMYHDVKRWINGCLLCQTRKFGKSQHGAVGNLVATRPFQTLHTPDHMGPFKVTSTGMRHILVVIDLFTQWVEIIAVKDTTAKETAKHFVERIICRHGCPDKIISDRGSAFFGAFRVSVESILRIKHRMSSAYHPQGNSKVERVNRVIKTALTNLVNLQHNDWHKYLQFIQMGHNSSIVEGLFETPFFLMHGRDMKMPLDTKTSAVIGDANVRKFVLKLIERLRKTYASVRKNDQKVIARN